MMAMLSIAKDTKKSILAGTRLPSRQTTQAAEVLKHNSFTMPCKILGNSSHFAMKQNPPLPSRFALELLERCSDPCAIFSPESEEPIWSNAAWNREPALATEATESQPESLHELPFAKELVSRLHQGEQGCTVTGYSAGELTETSVTVPELQATANIIYYAANDQNCAAVLITGKTTTSQAGSKPTDEQNIDHLTGLPGREFIVSRIGQRLGKNQQVAPPPFALLFIDLDGFKQVNDNHGHVVGDQVLATVSRRLAGAIRGSDVIARYGGDEFLVLVENIRHATETAPVITRLRQAAELPVRIDSRSLQLSASIGIAHSSEEWRSVRDLIALADARMYADKKSN